MSVKINGHTIASKLRKMFSSNGQTVASNLDGEIPSGGGSAPYIVDVVYDGDGDVDVYQTNKTWQEIHDAYMSGVPVFFHFPDAISGDYVYRKDAYYTVTGVSEQPNDHEYYIYFAFGDGLETITASNSPNNYPKQLFER